ncbi:hypothetical protein BCR36DRAFT_305694, partial [Piromyces finnis]
NLIIFKIKKMEDLTNYYINIINKIIKKATKVFNENYNLNISEDNILKDLIKEKDDVKDLTEDIEKLTVQHHCIATKKDNTKCTKKCVAGHAYCGIHSYYEGKFPFNEHIANVTKQFQYNQTLCSISLGNDWIIHEIHKETSRWPKEIINDDEDNSLSSYILFFPEFTDGLGAGILVIQRTSPNKKESYFMATHYVEVNKYIESLRPPLYAKIYLKSIEFIKENKDLYNKIKEFLEAYGIPYRIKKFDTLSPDNPLIMYNRIINIIIAHRNIMYFNYEHYINFKLE